MSEIPAQVFSARRVMVAGTATPAIRETALTVQQAAEAADGTSPFDEHTVLSLRPAGRDARDGTAHSQQADGTADGDGMQRHLVLFTAQDGAEHPVGYAHLDIATLTEPASAEFAVHPQNRRHGHGRALLEALIEVHHQTRASAVPLQVWSHGDQPGARVLAGQLGFTVVRALHQMRRPLENLDTPDAGPEGRTLPGGATLRTFRPGQDDAEWLRLNAKAFAHHPEQGRMTQADLDARMSEPWFDPDGFLIAERDGAMIGFHWTKVHPAQDGHGALGEVYVVGVDPDHHGGGLGRALTLAGLRSLRAQGLRTVLLYVESDNAPALAVYRRLQFEVWSTDVRYRSTD